MLLLTRGFLLYQQVSCKHAQMPYGLPVNTNSSWFFQNEMTEQQKNDDHDCLSINRSVELFKFTISNQCMMAKATCSAYYPKSSICYVELSLFQFHNKNGNATTSLYSDVLWKQMFDKLSVIKFFFAIKNCFYHE